VLCSNEGSQILWGTEVVLLPVESTT